MIHLKLIDLPNGESLGYRERDGGEETLLLIHGNMTSSKHWDLVLENIDPTYKVYAVDLRGFGISTYNNPIKSIKDFSDDVKLFVDALGLKDFNIVGWSMGGTVSMQFVAHFQNEFKVNKMILIGSGSTRGFPFYQTDRSGKVQRAETMEEILKDKRRTQPLLNAYKNKDKEFLRQLFNIMLYPDNQPSEPRYDEYLEDVLTQRNLPDVYYALNRFNISEEHNGLAAGTAEVKNITIPTLVLWGNRDLAISKQMTDEIVKDIGENAHLVILNGCGHSPLIDDLPLLLKNIAHFLNKDIRHKEGYNESNISS